MIWNGLDKSHTNLYKGIGILLIMMHNFLHRFSQPKENEMDFDPNRINELGYILSEDPAGAFRGIMSYFGHFGVQIFVFLSAYGISTKYKEKEIKYFHFISNRLKKIYIAFVLAIVFYVLYMSSVKIIILGENFENIFYFVEQIYKPILIKLTLTFNLIPGQGFSIVGPWWFMGMIFQFYLIFPLIFNAYKRYGESFLALPFTISLLIILYSKGYIGEVSIFFTILGHLPVFIIGIYLSRYNGNINTIILPISISIFYIGNINDIFFLLSHLSILISFIFISYNTIKKINNNTQVYKLLYELGVMSMPLFLLNGFLRFPLENIAHRMDNELITIFLCMLFISLCYFMSLLFININKWILQKL
ncbi:acyltransferase [Vibrio breoganii]